MTSKSGKFQAKADNTVRAEDRTSATPISLCRESESALKAKTNKPAAIPIVDTDTARLLIAGVILKEVQSSESIGWNRYNWAKTERPDRNMQFLINRKRFVSFSAFTVVFMCIRSFFMPQKYAAREYIHTFAKRYFSIVIIDKTD